MKVISSTGYGFTGSTAITDLISEYSSVKSCPYTGFELKFFHDINGILNLYNFLVMNTMPGTMNIALLKYYERCKTWATSGTSMNYELFFNNHFMEYTKEYVENLGGEDYLITRYANEMTQVQTLILRVVNKMRYTLDGLLHEKGYAESLVKPSKLFTKEKKFYLISVTEEEFIRHTKNYLMKLMEQFCNDQIANIHELIPINLIDDCSRYFEDLCIIKTERDPRDIFLTARHKYLSNGHASDDVHFFCKNYKWLRSLVKDVKKTKVLNIQFEDLALNYDETVQQIEEFAGLNASDHVEIKTRFIPEKASLNCNLKNKYPEEKENIEIIERELKDWLYDF